MVTELGGYEIIGKIAEGGMAEVFHARSTVTTWRKADEPKEVAIKRLRDRFRNDEKFVTQFSNEGYLTEQLIHPNIVRTYQYFTSEDSCLMVQELVDGITLHALMKFLAKTQTLLDPALAISISIHLLRGLDYVHSGTVGSDNSLVVHRDVGPSNILLSRTGEVKLADFGVAEINGVMPATPGTLRGTPGYMSPEAASGESVDQRTDLFATGVVLFEMLSGRRLFSGRDAGEVVQRVMACEVPNIHTLNPFLPEEIVAVLGRALTKDKHMRFQTSDEFMFELTALSLQQQWKIDLSPLVPLVSRAREMAESVSRPREPHSSESSGSLPNPLLGNAPRT